MSTHNSNHHHIRAPLGMNVLEDEEIEEGLNELKKRGESLQNMK